jgi:hypothetical protein
MKNNQLLKLFAALAISLVVLAIASSCSRPCLDCVTTWTTNGNTTKTEYFQYCGSTKDYREMIVAGNRQEHFNGQVQQVVTLCNE